MPDSRFDEPPLLSEPLVASLESPVFQRFRPGRVNRFAGFVLPAEGARRRGIEARSGGRLLGRYPADLPSPDLASLLPGRPAAAAARFAFDLEVAAGTESLELALEGSAGAPLVSYPVARIARLEPWLDAMRRGLAALPAPDPELVFATQGGRDVASYQDSIVPGVYNLKRYLAAAGVDPGEVTSILDFGCGTGRLLAGWWLDAAAGGAVPPASRRLAGCDVNRALVAWARGHLPAEMAFEPTGLQPPLPYPDAAFDLVQAVSVFTHLGLETQRRWVAELRRVLRPGGHLLATFHGPLYVRLLGGEAEWRAFAERGYLEGRHGDEGSNPFASFHSEALARELCAGLEAVAAFPEGRIGGERTLFPIAMVQDVYLWRKT